VGNNYIKLGGRMTQEELTALVEILNRVPMTVAERIFIRTLVEKLDGELKLADVNKANKDME